MLNENSRVGFEKDLVRVPGQSVNEELIRYQSEQVYVDLVCLLFSGVAIVLIWIHQLLPFPSSPFILTIISVLVMIFFGYRLRSSKKRIRSLNQGLDGERFVGQLLENMRAEGYVVFHDLIANNFNIDHIIIGPRGIFVIETKTWSKGAGKGKISYKDGVFELNGRILEKNPLDQATANANWFRNFLKESTGKIFSVKPVVLLPGWFIEPDDTRRAMNDGVILINPKATSAFVKNSSSEINDEDVHLVAYHTSLHIKSKNNNK